MDAILTPRRFSDFWKGMETNIFAETRLLKIVHNLRPIVDYLFHKHAIELINVFDTQV